MRPMASKKELDALRKVVTENKELFDPYIDKFDVLFQFDNINLQTFEAMLMLANKIVEFEIIF
jgi:hypothetical protein